MHRYPGEDRRCAATMCVADSGRAVSELSEESGGSDCHRLANRARWSRRAGRRARRPVRRSLMDGIAWSSPDSRPHARNECCGVRRATAGRRCIRDCACAASAGARSTRRMSLEELIALTDGTRATWHSAAPSSPSHRQRKTAARGTNACARVNACAEVNRPHQLSKPAHGSATCDCATRLIDRQTSSPTRTAARRADRRIVRHRRLTAQAFRVQERKTARRLRAHACHGACTLTTAGSPQRRGRGTARRRTPPRRRRAAQSDRCARR